MHWELSGLGDEITEMFVEQLAVLNELEIPNVEIRRFRLEGGEQKVINEATEADLEGLAVALQEAGIACAGIASPVGKHPVGEPFAPDLERFRGALQAAQYLKSPYLRVFSSYVPEGPVSAEHRTEALRRLREIAELAAREMPEVIVVVENESELYGEGVAACVDILESLDMPNLKMVCDACNFVVAGVDPYEEAWEALKGWIAYFHIKDALGPGQIVLAGTGKARWPELLRAARDERIGSHLTLEPHLALAGRSFGDTGPELYGDAKRALDGLLADLG